MIPFDGGWKFELRSYMSNTYSFTLRARKSADTRIRLSRARRRQMNTYRRAAAALSPLHLVAQRERSARARLKEKLQNAAYKQETVKCDSDSDSDESDDDEDLKM